MNRSLRAAVVTLAMGAGILIASAGSASAATPGELNLNLVNDCPDLSQHWQAAPDECVQLLQQDLNIMGASVLEDGFFGPQTQGALTRFQASFGLNPTGVADRDTRHSLQEDVDAKQQTAGYDPNAGPNAICDTLSGSGIFGKIGNVLGTPCKIILDTGTAG